MRNRLLMVGAAAFALLTSSGPVHAQGKTLRLAINADAGTLDPHAQNAFLVNMTLEQVYEALTTRGKDLKVEPSLATRWDRLEPTRWRFALRPNVKWHDGTAFTADDVVFSLKRAMAPTSNYTIYIDSLAEAVRVDDLTVEILTKAPDAILPDKLTRIFMMSKAWSEANKSELPQNFAAKENTVASRTAMGTGPYILRSREIDVRTVFARNPNWWGVNEGNVETYIQLPIINDATRTSALLSGEIDITNFVPYQDVDRLKSQPQIKVLEGMENRTVFLGMDQSRAELLYGDVKGKNPFKDARVRQAMAMSIDMETIKSRILKGQAFPTNSMWTPYVNGYDKANDQRPPLDRAKAQKLMAEAGYAEGFKVALDCPNGNYAQACVAVAGQLAQINIKIDVNLVPAAVMTQKWLTGDTSFYGLSWGVPTFDALYTLRGIIMSKDKVGASSFNAGRYSNATVDSLIERVGSEIDGDKRRALITEALAIHNTEVGHIPLYHIVIPWAMSSKVNVVHRADNVMLAKWAKVE
jgi:peptide/nickel transport system substrate-binding protein